MACSGKAACEAGKLCELRKYRCKAHSADTGRRIFFQPDHAKIKQLYSKQDAIRSAEWTRGIVSKDSTGYDACVSQYRAVCSAGIQRKIYKFHYAQGGEETIGCAECGRAKTAGTISFAQPYQNKLRDSAVSVHRFACGRTMRPDLGRY